MLRIKETSYEAVLTSTTVAELYETRVQRQTFYCWSPIHNILIFIDVKQNVVFSDACNTILHHLSFYVPVDVGLFVFILHCV